MSTKSITVVTLNPIPTLIQQLKALLMEAKQSPSDIVLDLSSIDVLETDELELLNNKRKAKSRESKNGFLRSCQYDTGDSEVVRSRQSLQNS